MKELPTMQLDEPALKNGRSYIGERIGSLVIVSLKWMRETKGGGARQSVWRANCDCSPKNFVLDSLDNMRRKGMCEDCMKAARKNKREARNA